MSWLDEDFDLGRGLVSFFVVERDFYFCSCFVLRWGIWFFNIFVNCVLINFGLVIIVFVFVR